MKLGVQTKKKFLSSKVTNAEMIDRFQDGRCRHVETSSAFYKLGNFLRTFMKMGTHTKQNMLSAIVMKAEAHGKKQLKVNVTNDIILKRQRCVSAKL
jgi:hypothetical protein